MSDEIRKAMVLDYLQRAILYHRAAEEGLQVVPDEPPQPPHEILFDLAATAAGAIAAIAEFHLTDGAGDLMKPSPQAREIAADFLSKAIDGHMPTPEDMHWITTAEKE